MLLESTVRTGVGVTTGRARLAGRAWLVSESGGSFSLWLLLDLKLAAAWGLSALHPVCPDCSLPRNPGSGGRTVHIYSSGHLTKRMKRHICFGHFISQRCRRGAATSPAEPVNSPLAPACDTRHSQPRL